MPPPPHIKIKGKRSNEGKIQELILPLLQLKSSFPKPDKSTFGTSEKNRFLFDRIYTHVYGKTKFRFKKMYLHELSGSKFHSVTSSNVILYNDVKSSIFIIFLKWIYQVLEMSSSIIGNVLHKTLMII